MVPLATDKRRAKHTRWIHRRPGERAAEKNIERDGQSNGQATDFGSADINGRTVDNKSQEESEHSLDANALDRSSAFAKRRRAFGYQFLARNSSALEQKS